MDHQQNTRGCAFQDCQVRMRPPHELCPAHWMMKFDKLLIRCSECRIFRHQDEETCETCRRRGGQSAKRAAAGGAKEAK